MAKRPSKTGYSKPPIATQIKAGQSGNPKGRPKGSKNLRTLIKQAADAKIVVQEGGRRKKVSKMDLAVTQMMNKAAQGEPRFVHMALDQVRSAETELPGDNRTDDFAEADRRIIAQVLERMRRNQEGA
jgi:hypothetical protein